MILLTPNKLDITAYSGMILLTPNALHITARSRSSLFTPNAQHIPKFHVSALGRSHSANTTYISAEEPSIYKDFMSQPVL